MVVEDFSSEVFGTRLEDFLLANADKKKTCFSFVLLRRRIEYKCKGDSACQVDVNRRNQCQACRFQRCLTVKMKPSGENN